MIYEVLTPDHWVDPLGLPIFTRDGQACTVYDAVGTTPDKTPILNHIGVSGGKDSDALFLWARYESGYSVDSIVMSFCDTGNEDLLTHQQIAEYRRRHRCLTIKPGKDFWALVDHKRMFPTRKRRFCTEFLKMEPTRYFVHALVDAGFKVLLHAGVRASESADRAKLSERDFDGYFALVIYRPLLFWTLQQVIDIHTRWQFPFNGLYRKGARRVGCFPCINSVKKEVRIVSEFRPEKINFIHNKEIEVSSSAERSSKGVATFFHRKTVPLRFRSLDYTTSSGEKIQVASILDVVRWSLTGNRARGRHDDQHELDFKETGAACSLTYGACE